MSGFFSVFIFTILFPLTLVCQTQVQLTQAAVEFIVKDSLYKNLIMNKSNVVQKFLPHEFNVGKEIVDDIYTNWTEDDLLKFLNKNELDVYDTILQAYDRRGNYSFEQLSTLSTNRNSNIWFFCSQLINNTFFIEIRIVNPSLKSYRRNYQNITIITAHYKLVYFFRFDDSGEIIDFESKSMG